MANTLKLDHENGLIVMDRVFAKKSENTMSNEYAHLQNVRRDYPMYTVVRHTIKKNANKETYRGLTYDFMRYYIDKYEPKKTKETVKYELETKIEISKCHAVNRRYPTIKKWFLEKYPEVALFGMTDAELSEYEETKRKAEEAKRRAAEETKMSQETDDVAPAEEEDDAAIEQNSKAVNFPQEDEDENEDAA